MRYYDLTETPKTGKTFLSQNDSNTRIQQDNASVSIYFTSVDLSVNERYFDDNGYPKIRAINTVESSYEQKTAALEAQRDRLLKGSDWYVVRKSESGVDIPVDISEYRESLRTIDELEGYPDIDLPEQPEGIKFIY
jgi:hypothetical protein